MNFPRVTEVLRAYTNYEKIPNKILENKAAIGTSVHALCAEIAKGGWVPDGMIAEEHLGYVNSFRKWAATQVKKFVIIEKRFQNQFLGFTGQIDQVILGHDDKLYLADLKCSAKPNVTHPVQMAAYEFLLQAHEVKLEGSMLVYLKKDGEFPDIDFYEDLLEERYIFFKALDCYKYFNKKEKHERKDSPLTIRDTAA